MSFNRVCLFVQYILIIAGGVSPCQAFERIAPSQCRVDAVTFSRAAENGVTGGASAVSVSGQLNAVCNARPLRAGERVAYCWHIQESNSAGAARFELKAEQPGRERNSGIRFSFRSAGQDIGGLDAPKNIWGIAAPQASGIYQMNAPLDLVIR